MVHRAAQLFGERSALDMTAAVFMLGKSLQPQLLPRNRNSATRLRIALKRTL
jgi:hypothetical protein